MAQPNTFYGLSHLRPGSGTRGAVTLCRRLRRSTPLMTGVPARKCRTSWRTNLPRCGALGCVRGAPAELAFLLVNALTAATVDVGLASPKRPGACGTGPAAPAPLRRAFREALALAGGTGGPPGAAREGRRPGALMTSCSPHATTRLAATAFGSSRTVTDSARLISTSHLPVGNRRDHLR